MFSSSLPRDPPDLTSLSSLSMEGDGTLDLGLPGREHSDPASKESSWFIISSSLTHLWQTLCWQGRISGWVKSSLQMGQISSLSMFLIGTWWWRHGCCENCHIDTWNDTFTFRIFCMRHHNSCCHPGTGSNKGWRRSGNMTKVFEKLGNFSVRKQGYSCLWPLKQ